MAENSLSPAFVKIDYSSAAGAHVMTLPSVPVIAGAYAPTGYAFQLRGLAVPVAVDTAVIAFVNKLKPFFPTTVNFIDAVVYSQPTPTDIPTPVASFAINIPGTAAAPGWWKAVQQTYTIRADDFTLFKLVLLDVGSFGTFDKMTVIPPATDERSLVDYVTADVTWLASRGGGRPATFLQRSATLNEKLRRAYNMT